MKNQQTALITGATSGIGLEFAKQFSAMGYDLILVSRNQEKLHQVKNQLNGSSMITCIQSDLSEVGSAEAVFNTCREKDLVVDVLINNAGVGVFGDHVGLQTEEIQKLITLNTSSLTLLCRYFGNEMKNRRAGYILNIASTAAYQPVPLFATYAATKAYVLHFSEALTKELEDYGVYVTCLSPGHTKTDFFTQAGIEDSEGGFFSSKNMMTAENVAQAGINGLFKRKISTIPGVRNNFMAFTSRLASRERVANVSKKFTSNP